MSPARRIAITYAIAAGLVLSLLFAWQRGTYPNYAEGVYLFSSRLILEGDLLDRDFIAAHPPLLFYAGAGILLLWDLIDGVRVMLSLLSMGTGALVAACVFRLTRNWIGAVVAGVASILAPWSLHEYALLRQADREPRRCR